MEGLRSGGRGLLSLHPGLRVCVCVYAGGLSWLPGSEGYGTPCASPPPSTLHLGCHTLISFGMQTPMKLSPGGGEHIHPPPKFSPSLLPLIAHPTPGNH